MDLSLFKLRDKKVDRIFVGSIEKEKFTRSSVLTEHSIQGNGSKAAE